ncbi:hypothetical protein ABPG72_021560 [Tetrahymena utriculariae]
MAEEASKKTNKQINTQINFFTFQLINKINKLIWASSKQIKKSIQYMKQTRKLCNFIEFLQIKQIQLIPNQSFLLLNLLTSLLKSKQSTSQFDQYFQIQNTFILHNCD